MKVLFTLGGLPHYYNSVLNRLNRIGDLEIVVVAPNEKGKTIGKGVHQKKEGIEFRLIQLDEYTTFYKKPFLKGFSALLKEEKPDVIVTIWPYILAFIFVPKLNIRVLSGKIKLLLKEIPFGVPKLKNAIGYYSNKNLRAENLEIPVSSNKFINIFKFGLLTFFRLIYYHYCKAYLNYIEEAFEILGSYGINKHSIFITYNSPDTEVLFKAKEEVDKSGLILPENKFRLIHVGRLVKWKRVDLLIKTTAQLKNKFPDVELVVIGEGPQINELKSMADSLNIKEKIKFIGSIYNPVLLGKYFKVSSVYVLAGMGGLSINEAMSFGKPIICSVCDGTEKKLVREGFNGLFFKEGDEADLYRKIDYLFSNPELIENMGKNSFKIIQDEVNIHTVISGYVRAFNYVSKNKFNLKYNRQR